MDGVGNVVERRGDAAGEDFRRCDLKKKYGEGECDVDVEEVGGG